MNRLPEVLLDHEKYPTEEYLSWLKAWDEVSPEEINIFLKTVIESLSRAWLEPEYGIVVHRKRNGMVRYELHTGEWSGNEEIITSLKQNFYFWMFWEMSRVGGHHYFLFNANLFE